MVDAAFSGNWFLCYDFEQSRCNQYIKQNDKLFRSHTNKEKLAVMLSYTTNMSMNKEREFLKEIFRKFDSTHWLDVCVEW